MGASVLGFAAHGPSREADCAQAGELYVLYVEPSAWGHGLGRLLLSHVESALLEDGFVEAILWVAEKNARARRFYERAGWSLDGARKNDDGTGELRYRRDLMKA